MQPPTKCGRGLRSSGFRYWDRLWIGTFHSFGAYLLTCYGSDVGVREDFEVIDADVRLQELEQIAANTLKSVTAQDLGKAIENLKRQGIYPDHNEHHISTSLQPAYRAYQVRLRELNCVDFGDLVALALRLLVESPLPSRIFKTYFRYILADEFQDTDAQQLELVCLLSQSALGSTVVADDDQSIYRFRGAHRQNIYEIERRLGATRCILGANFRSDQVIVEAAQAVMAGDRDRATKALRATSVERGRLFFRQFTTTQDEAAQVAAWIREAIATGKVSHPGEICLICRARWRMQDTIAQLSAVGVPWFDRSRLRFEDSLETRLGLATLSLACSPDSSDELFDLISAIESGGLAYRLGEVDALDVAREVRRRVKFSQAGMCSPSTVAEILEIAGVQDILGQVALSQTEARRMSKKSESDGSGSTSPKHRPVTSSLWRLFAGYEGSVPFRSCQDMRSKDWNSTRCFSLVSRMMFFLATVRRLRRIFLRNGEFCMLVSPEPVIAPI